MGVINNALMSLGIIEQPISMLYTEFAVLVGTIYLFLPIMIITLVGVMDNIDNDMMEAAESLGANRLTAFIKVVLPMRCSRNDYRSSSCFYWIINSIHNATAFRW